MQAVALIKVIVLGATAAADSDFVIRVMESAGVTRHVGSSGTVVKIFN